jgi:hypothetical protein
LKRKNAPVDFQLARFFILQPNLFSYLCWGRERHLVRCNFLLEFENPFFSKEENNYETAIRFDGKDIQFISQLFYTRGFCAHFLFFFELRGAGGDFYGNEHERQRNGQFAAGDY